MKKKERKTLAEKRKYLLLGFIPIVKETLKAPLIGETTINYRLFGATILKILPIKQDIIET